MERPASALSQEPDSDNDYTLRQNPPGCWITVDTITVRISRCFEGVKVQLFPTGYEHDECLLGELEVDYFEACVARVAYNEEMTPRREKDAE